jgi:hypothetical protein
MCRFGGQSLWSQWLAVDPRGEIRARRLGDGGWLEAIGQGPGAVGKPLFLARAETLKVKFIPSN